MSDETDKYDALQLAIADANTALDTDAAAAAAFAVAASKLQQLTGGHSSSDQDVGVAIVAALRARGYSAEAIFKGEV